MLVCRMCLVLSFLLLPYTLYAEPQAGHNPEAAAALNQSRQSVSTAFSPLDYHSLAVAKVGDCSGSTAIDSRPAFQRSITELMPSGNPLVIAPGIYCVKGSLVLPNSGQAYGGLNSVWTVRGEGRSGDIGFGPKGATLVFTSGGIVSDSVGSVKYENLSIFCLASAGPAFDFRRNTGETVIDGVSLVSYNPALPLIRARTGKGDIIGFTLRNFSLTPAVGQKVPAVDFLNEQGNSAMNELYFENGQVHGSSTSVAPVFKIDNGSYSGCWNNEFRRIAFEVVPSGAIELDSCEYTMIDTVSDADTPRPSASLITLKANALGDPIDGIQIHNLVTATGTPIHPAVLVDNTALTPYHAYGEAQVMLVGGRVPNVRVKGSPPVLVKGTYLSDRRDVDFLQANGTAGYALNSSSPNGTVSLVQNPSDPFNGTLAGCAGGQDLTLSTADDHTVYSASYKFTPYDIGGYVQVTSGAGWTRGSYQVIGVDKSGQAVLKTSPGKVLSDGSWNVNRGRIAFAALGDGLTDEIRICRYHASGSFIWDSLASGK